MPEAPGRSATAEQAPAAPDDPQRICASSELQERGHAALFDLLEHGQPLRGFALRIDGRVVAYLNRCAHVPMELDWTPGVFLDADREFIMCSTHGAVYAPPTGHCLGGPCLGRGGLTPIHVVERAGSVWWLPSATLRPVSAAASPASR